MDKDDHDSPSSPPPPPNDDNGQAIVPFPSPEPNKEVDHNSPPPPPPPPSPPPPLRPTNDDNDQGIAAISSPEPNNEEDDEYAEKMKNFTELIFKSAELASTTGPLSPEFKTLIGKRIEEIFPLLLRTPDHPPYQIMIRDAIVSMNEDGGSTAEAISQYIQNKHPDLPYAHNVFLQHYLEQLCQNGAVATAGDRYCMRNPDVTPSANLAIVCCDESSSSSGSSISSSASWSSSASSDTSFSNFPIPKRRRHMPSRTRPRAETLLPCATKRQGSANRKALEKQIVVRLKEPQFSLVPKSKGGKGKKHKRRKSINQGKNKSNIGKEVVPNANILTLDGPKGSEEQTGRKDGRRCAVLACHDPITGKRRRLIDIDLDELEDLVNEDSMEIDLIEGSTEKGKSVAEDVAEKQMKKPQSHDLVVYEKRDSSETRNKKETAEDEESILGELGFELLNGKLQKKTVQVPEREAAGALTEDVMLHLAGQVHSAP